MIDSVVQTPLAFYEQGKSYLLSGEPYESLRYYAKALQISLKEQEIELARNSINALPKRDELLGYEWVQKLLLIGLACKFPEADAGKAALDQIKQVASKPHHRLEKPIFIVAGRCSVDVEAQMHPYKVFILETFGNFKGTIISGGTISGVSGLIGEVQQKYPSAVRTVGYVPKTETDLLDKRYSEIRFTDGETFSPIEPLQYWIDIIASGLKSLDIKLLGINGGRISAIEYRLALALGARVAIVKGSGMEADKLLSDSDWNASGNLGILSNDSLSAWAFIRGDKES
jgi:hypothetical protein